MQKKLYKANEGKMVDGVCAGIAEYLNVDPTVVRAIWAVVTCFGGMGIPAYILCAVIIPRKPSGYIDA